MADKLKHFFNEQIIREIGDDFDRVHAPLRKELFVRACMKGLADLELTQRAWHIAEVMHDHLPQPFAVAARVITDSLGPEHASSESFGMAPFRYAPHVFFVQKYGLDDFEAAMQAQYELTKRFSAESSIRAYLLRYPDETYARLREWARDKNVHVRRLVSEGTRPRLPWAPRLRAFLEDPPGDRAARVPQGRSGALRPALRGQQPQRHRQGPPRIGGRGLPSLVGRSI